MFVNEKSEFDLITLKVEEMLKLQKWHMITSFKHIYARFEILKFEWGHAMVIPAFDSDLEFKVKYWPKFGTWAKFNSHS